MYSKAVTLIFKEDWNVCNAVASEAIAIATKSIKEIIFRYLALTLMIVRDSGDLDFC